MEYWADSKAAPGGNGLSINTPYNTIPGNTFGNGNIWNLKYGSVFDLGAATLLSGNSALVRAYGDTSELNPLITGTAAPIFNCSTAAGAVVFEDVTFMRSGAQSGTGLLPFQMTHVDSSFTMRRCVVAGFTLAIDARRTRRLTLDRCTILGSGTTYGLRGQAHTPVSTTYNAENWLITDNTFDCGTSLELHVSDDLGTLGAFNNLTIEGNVMGLAIGQGGSAMFLQGKCNATDYPATSKVDINTPGPGVHTLTRVTGGAWPAWPNGTVIFLAGWGAVANFGTVTVTGGGGTTAVTVTNLGATLVSEGVGDGKGAGIRDPLRAFVNTSIKNNTFRNCGLTPMFIHNFVGGVLENNTIQDTVAAGAVAAAIESFNSVGTIARYNTIRNMTGTVTVDSMGIFWDGACENCVAHGNYIRGIRPTSAAENSGAAMAAFYSKGCSFNSNIIEDCKTGLWVGGNATTQVTCTQNTISECGTGLLVNGSPAAGSVTIKNNAVQKCTTGIKDSASSVVLNNAWWQNVANTHTGTLAAKDAAAITADPKLSPSMHPMLGSSLIRAGAYLGPARDAKGVRRPNPPSIGAQEPATLRRIG